jgi:hypothetical protein
MTEDPRLLSILSDQPADEDRLDFDPYAQTLADVVADPDTDTPLTIGVFGGWGRGKASLMRMVRRRLQATAESKFPVRTVWFNAWLYNREEALWRALISRVLEAARTFPTLDDPARDTLRGVEARLYPPTAPPGGHLTLAPGALAGLDGGSLPTLTGLELLRRQAERGGDADTAARLQELIADVEESQAITRRDQIAALDECHRQFERISRTCIVPHGRLAVFVDDLDRCLPDQAVEVLEAVKLFLDVPGCVFVLGVDREVIEQGIRVRYADYEAHRRRALYGEDHPDPVQPAPHLDPRRRNVRPGGDLRRAARPPLRARLRRGAGAQPAPHQAHAQHLPAPVAAGPEPCGWPKWW